jgi:hypothetical protein
MNGLFGGSCLEDELSTWAAAGAARIRSVGMSRNGLEK